MTENDVLLTPELGNMSSLDFHRVVHALQKGSAAATGADERLRRFSVSIEEFDRWRQTQRRVPKPPPIVQGIRIRTDSKLSDAVIRSRIRSRLGQPLDLQILREDIADIYGMSYFDRVGFQLTNPRTGALERSDEPERVDVLIDAKRNFLAPAYLRFGVRLEDDLEGNSTFDVACELKFTEINALGAEWRNTLQVGNTDLVSTRVLPTPRLGRTVLRSRQYGLLSAPGETLRPGTADRRVPPFDFDDWLRRR